MAIRRSQSVPVETILALPAGSDVHAGDILRLEQAPTDNALLAVGATINVAEVLREPWEVDGGLEVAVKFLGEDRIAQASVVMKVEAKKPVPADG